MGGYYIWIVDMQAFGYAGFLVCRYFNIQVIGHVDMWIRRYLDMNYVGIWMCIVQVWYVDMYSMWICM